MAVIELASLEQFREIHLTFLEQLGETIGVVLNTILANTRTEEPTAVVAGAPLRTAIFRTAELEVTPLCGALRLLSRWNAPPLPRRASTFQMTYVSQKPGASGGIDTLMTWSDPSEPGAKPKRGTKIRFGFHPGTRIDTKALFEQLCAVLSQADFDLGAR